jgi:hypothetical protein
MLAVELPTISTTTGIPSGVMNVVLFARLPMISKFADPPLFTPYAADAHRISMEIRTISFLILSPPFYN